MKEVIATYPTLRAVMPDELKAHLHLDSSDELGTLDRLLQDAEGYAEEYTGRKLLTQTWDQYFDAWQDPIKLAYAPVQSLSSVKYIDSNGTLQPLATSIYELGEINQRGIVRRQYNQQWPTARGQDDAIVIRYICGYTAPERVPGLIRRAILMHAAWHYRNRGDAAPTDYRAVREPGAMPEAIERTLRWSMHWYRMKEF